LTHAEGWGERFSPDLSGSFFAKFRNGRKDRGNGRRPFFPRHSPFYEKIEKFRTWALSVLKTHVIFMLASLCFIKRYDGTQNNM